MMNDKIGIRNQMNCGEYCEVIAQHPNSKIDVRFDDGNIVKDKFYGNFKKGQISNTKNRIGEVRIMNCGLSAKIIKYNKFHDVSIEFEDGYIVNKKSYDDFLKGEVGHNIIKTKFPIKSKDKIGLKRKMNCGMDCEIIEYFRNDDITVRFSDGTIIKNRTFNEFKNGMIKNRNIKQIKTNRLGEEIYNKDGNLLKIIRYDGAKDIDVIMNSERIFKNKTYYDFKNKSIGNVSCKNKDFLMGLSNTNIYNEKFTVIEYNNYLDIVVEFDNGYRMNTSNSSFINGRCYSPYAKTKRNVGYMGEGSYDSHNSKIYNTWDGMFTRCYDEEYQKQKPTYIGCHIDKEWHNFQNFAGWFDENYYECGNEMMCLDKDILVKGNKEYSKDTCMFVPQNINSLFTKCDGARGNLPIGITKKNNRYLVRINNYMIEGKRREYGSYNNVLDAFDCYKREKENIIKQVADQYASKYPNFPQKLYDAMYSYQVEITD